MMLDLCAVESTEEVEREKGNEKYQKHEGIISKKHICSNHD